MAAHSGWGRLVQDGGSAAPDCHEIQTHTCTCICNSIMYMYMYISILDVHYIHVYTYMYLLHNIYVQKRIHCMYTTAHHLYNTCTCICAHVLFPHLRKNSQAVEELKTNPALVTSDLTALMMRVRSSLG